MDYFPADETNESPTDLEGYFTELERIVRELALKHNDLVVSTSLLWSEVQRSTSDPLTKHLCNRRLDEMTQLLYAVPGALDSENSPHLPANEYYAPAPSGLH